VRRLLLLLSLWGCTTSPQPCPPPVPPFEPGTFVSKGGSRVRSGGSFAHAEAGAKTLVLEQQDDNSALVRITYQRGGKTIVETWTNVPASGFPWAKPNDIPMLRPSATLHDFGSVMPGESSMTSIQVSNRTEQPFSAQTTVTGDGFAVHSSDCGAPQAVPRCTVQISFRPPSRGLFSGVLTVTPRLGSPVTVALSGAGVYLPRPDGSPDAPLPGDASADSPPDPPVDSGGDVDPGG